MKDTKEHILNVSFGLFLQKSFKEVTLKEIVEKTGMSKGAFYHYFSSKEQIFLEIIQHAFSSILYIDFSQFSQNSLHAFYHGYIGYMNRVYQTVQDLVEDKGAFDLNYYSLIFDAIRLFPDFRDKMIESTRVETETWVKVISAAKEKEEIDTTMTDTQIAQIFMHTNSGVGMDSLMLGKGEDATNVLLNLWDSFYGQLKR